MNALALYGRYVAASLRAQAQYPAATLMLTAGHFAGHGDRVPGRLGAVPSLRPGRRLVASARSALFYGAGQHHLLDRRPADPRLRRVRHGVRAHRRLRPRAAAAARRRAAAAGLRGAADAHRPTACRASPCCALASAASSRSHWDAGSGRDPGCVAVAGGVALFSGLLVLQATLAVLDRREPGGRSTSSPTAASRRRSIRSTSTRPGSALLLTFGVPLACVAYYPVLAILKRPDPLGAPDWLLPLTPLAGFAFLACRSSPGAPASPAMRRPAAEAAPASG